MPNSRLFLVPLHWLQPPHQLQACQHHSQHYHLEAWAHMGKLAKTLPTRANDGCPVDLPNNSSFIFSHFLNYFLQHIKFRKKRKTLDTFHNATYQIFLMEKMSSRPCGHTYRGDHKIEAAEAASSLSSPLRHFSTLLCNMYHCICELSTGHPMKQRQAFHGSVPFYQNGRSHRG